MIVSFGDAATEDLHYGHPSARVRWFPADIRKACARKLDMLDGALELADLARTPGNRLEALGGDRRGFHSIRINDQWRIQFRWTALGPASVTILDYH